jgi:hypothetical protein
MLFDIERGTFEMGCSLMSYASKNVDKKDIARLKNTNAVSDEIEAIKKNGQEKASDTDKLVKEVTKNTGDPDKI